MKPNDTNGLWDDGYLMKSTRERQRQVRVATGAMCRCRKCYCCEEWLKDKAEGKEMSDAVGK